MNTLIDTMALIILLLLIVLASPFPLVAAVGSCIFRCTTEHRV